MSLNQPIRRYALLLGMVFSEEDRSMSWGQMYRDKVRCLALESLGYYVCTLDDKHGDGSASKLMESKKTPVIIKDGRHCNTNFCDIRRFHAAVSAQWGSYMQFDIIALDYFFSPVTTTNYIFIIKLKKTDF
jgi:hypothetical protein